MPFKLAEFLKLGIDLVNKEIANGTISLEKFLKEYSGGEERTLVLRIDSASKRSEGFGFYIDTVKGIGITETYAVVEPTVEIGIDENLGWRIASRELNLAAIYFQGYPLDIKGACWLRDIATLDRVLETINDVLLTKDIDLRAILAGDRG